MVSVTSSASLSLPGIAVVSLVFRPVPRLLPLERWFSHFRGVCWSPMFWMHEFSRGDIVGVLGSGVSVSEFKSLVRQERPRERVEPSLRT